MLHVTTTNTTTLADFLLARIAEDEEIARAVPPLGHNYDMGGNRQDERWMFDRRLPSSADGMGNWSKHRGPETAAHFARHDPARVLAECEAKTELVEMHGDGKDYCYSCSGRVYDGRGPCNTLLVLAAIYADHPDHRQEWKISWLP